jgi:hypothetical protein
MRRSPAPASVPTGTQPDDGEALGRSRGGLNAHHTAKRTRPTSTMTARSVQTNQSIRLAFVIDIIGDDRLVSGCLLLYQGSIERALEVHHR